MDQGTILLKEDQQAVLQILENERGEGEGFNHEYCTGSSLLHLLAVACHRLSATSSRGDTQQPMWQARAGAGKA